MIPLIGYTDRLSGRPGDTIKFKVSSRHHAPYQAALVRVICADPNPAGPGMIEEAVDSEINGAWPSRLQPFYPGSYGSAAVDDLFHAAGGFALVATIWPTTPGGGRQGILSCRNTSGGNGVDLHINEDGCCGASISIAGGQEVAVHTGEKLKARNWYRVWASFDARSGVLQASVTTTGRHSATAHQSTPASAPTSQPRASVAGRRSTA